jgi:hypothetical protein
MPITGPKDAPPGSAMEQESIVASCALFFNSLPRSHRELLWDMAQATHSSVPSMIARVWTQAITHYFQELQAGLSLDAQERVRLMSKHAQEMARLEHEHHEAAALLDANLAAAIGKARGMKGEA